MNKKLLKFMGIILVIVFVTTISYSVDAKKSFTGNTNRERPEFQINPSSVILKVTTDSETVNYLQEEMQVSWHRLAETGDINSFKFKVKTVPVLNGGGSELDPEYILLEKEDGSVDSDSPLDVY